MSEIIEYQDFEFCKAVECPKLCCNKKGYVDHCPTFTKCPYSAKELHQWFIENGYNKIIKEAVFDKNQQREGRR